MHGDMEQVILFIKLETCFMKHEWTYKYLTHCQNDLGYSFNLKLNNHVNILQIVDVIYF